MNKLIASVLFAFAASLVAPAMAASHAGGAPMKAEPAKKAAAADKAASGATKKKEKAMKKKMEEPKK